MISLNRRRARKAGKSRPALVVITALVLIGCTNGEIEPRETQESEPVASISTPESREEGLLAGEPAAIKGGETYSEYDRRRDALEGTAGRYAGHGCTEDCSGHDAGYRWAEEHGITDADECGGNSWSFEEGCRSFAEEQQPTEDEESDGDDSGY